MRIFDIVYFAALNLYRRMGRSFLTIVGVIIGTTSIILMFSIGLTNFAQFEEMLDESELTKIQIMGDTMLSYSSGEFESTGLDDIAIEAFKGMEYIDRVVPIRNLRMHADVDKYFADHLNIIAIPIDEISNMTKLENGNYPSRDSAMPQIIMGMGVARQFIERGKDYPGRDYSGPSIDWLNADINLFLGERSASVDGVPSSRQYRANVVGIIEGVDEENPSYDVYIDLDKAKDIIIENYKLAGKLNYEVNTYDMAYIYVDDIENVKPVLKVLKQYGFEAYSDIEWVDEMQKQQRGQQSQLAAIGFISLIVSAIGIANTMMTGVLERQREIGVMKVIGVAIEKIRYIFLVEAGIIGLLGGLAGAILSHICAYILNAGAGETMFLGMYFSGDMKLVIPIWLDIAAIVIAIMIGVVAGVFPASRATRMDPLETIRG